MEILKQITILVTKNNIFHFNTNVFETNIINLSIFIIGIFISGKPILLNILSERQATIINNIKNSEKRLNESQARLSEAKKQLYQTQLIIEELKAETKLIKQNLLNNYYFTIKNELTRRLIAAKNLLKNKERLILNEIKKNVSSLAINQVIKILNEQTGNEEAHIFYMKESINKLGGFL